MAHSLVAADKFFRQFQPFQVVVEATASYVWFAELMEPLADKVVLAHPKKLRVIAESTQKTDRLDAFVLAKFLALDMIPRAYMPTPRQRQHRRLVRYRHYLRSRTTSVRCKIRHILADYNADRKDVFSANCGATYFKQVPLSDADRFVIKQLWSEFQDHQKRMQKITAKIRAFVAKAPEREKEARAIIKTAPGVGFVTAEVVISELGDVSRFSSAKKISAYAGLVPKVRQTGGKKSKDLAITKEGSGLFALGPGRVGLAVGQDQSEVDRLFLPTARAQRQQAGHRRRGQEAVVRALRDAQDVDSLQRHTHADQDTQDKATEIAEKIARVTNHAQNGGSAPDPGEGW